VKKMFVLQRLVETTIIVVLLKSVLVRSQDSMEQEPNLQKEKMPIPVSRLTAKATMAVVISNNVNVMNALMLSAEMKTIVVISNYAERVNALMLSAVITNIAKKFSQTKMVDSYLQNVCNRPVNKLSAEMQVIVRVMNFVTRQ